MNRSDQCYSNSVRAIPTSSKNAKARAPFIVYFVFLMTILADIGGAGILGYKVSGLTWFIPLSVALCLLPFRLRNIAFPLLIWLPWMGLIVFFLYFSEYPSLQRSAQLLCPIVVGMVASSYRYSPIQVESIMKTMRYMVLALSIIVLVKAGVLYSGLLPDVTGLAAEVMTAILLSATSAAGYAVGNSKDLIYWGIATSIPIIAVTRTAIIVAGSTLPFTFAPLKSRTRLLILPLIGIVGLALFYTPRMQSKMFGGEQGQMSDVLNMDFADSGRFFMWEQFKGEIALKPWFGYGAGAGEVFTKEITGGQSGYPHNDWLLTIYDYGFVGAGIFALTIIMGMRHALIQAKTALGNTRILFFASAASFLSFVMMMFTDNIMVYASFFGNLQFTILGIAYGSTEKSTPEGMSPRRRRRIRW